MESTSSLNTPEVSTASQRQLHNFEDQALEVNPASSLEVNPPSFDPALFLDDTVDFMSMMDPQATTKQENVPEFGDMNTWTDQVLAQVLDMENQQQQQQQQQVPPASSNNKKKRKQECGVKNNSHKKKKDKENVRPTPPSTPPTSLPRSKSQWPNIELFPSPQPVRKATEAATSTSIEGVVPLKKETRTVSTQTEDECVARGYPSYSNIIYETKSNTNLYETRAYKDVISKNKTGISYRSYMLDGRIMLNHQVDKHTLEVYGAWMNIRGSTDNNIPFQLQEMLEFLSLIVHQETSEPVINHLVGEGDVCIRMVTVDGELRILRRFRTISIDISSPEKFEEFRHDCARSYEVLLLLQSRHQQRKRLTQFLVDNPSPCTCPSGGASHLKHYYYSAAVSNLEDILPLEWVYKTYA